MQSGHRDFLDRLQSLLQERHIYLLFEQNEMQCHPLIVFVQGSKLFYLGLYLVKLLFYQKDIGQQQPYQPLLELLVYRE